MDKMLDAGFRMLHLKKKLFLFYQAPSIQYLSICLLNGNRVHHCFSILV